MAVGRRLRREIKQIDKWMRRESYRWGQQVKWYEFNPTSVSDSTDLDLYDEGGPQSRVGTTDQGTSRKWKAPKTVQVYMARLDEGAEQYSAEGQYEVDKLTLIVNAQMMRAAGITNPGSDDRVQFDGRIFTVDHYEPRGRLADVVLTVTVSCTQVMDDERMTDDASWHA